MNYVLFAQPQPPGNIFTNKPGTVIGIAVLVLLALFFLAIFFSFVRLWIQCFLTGAKISILDLVGMKLRNVDYAMIVRHKIALVQAGVAVSTQEMEAHYLARGNVPKTAAAVIAAHKAGIRSRLAQGRRHRPGRPRRARRRARPASIRRSSTAPIRPRASRPSTASARTAFSSGPGPASRCGPSSTGSSAGPPRRRSSPASARASSRPSARPSTTPTCWPIRT